MGSVTHPEPPPPNPTDVSGMNLEPGECGMNSVSCGNGKLRQWLIDQIDSGKYPGLVWENDEKSIFRIPWKHAGKQDYNREEDAALFKVGLPALSPFPVSELSGVAARRLPPRLCQALF